MLVSFYNNNKSLSAYGHFDVYEQLDLFKQGSYKVQIDLCRLALLNNDKAKYKNLKAELPAITFCGRFDTQRKADLITNYNNLIIIDIDDLDPAFLKTVRKSIENDIYTHACFLSPSGNGLKILIKVKTDVIFHKQAFRNLSIYYKDNFDVLIDKSGSDCSRLCYVSYDSELYVNKNSDYFIFETEALEKDSFVEKTAIGKKRTPLSESVFNYKNLKTSYGLNKPNDRKMISQIIKFLKKGNLSITSTQEAWYKCAYAIANSFSYDIGAKYFIALSELDGDKYDKEKCVQIIEYCYLNRKDEGGLHFSTIVFFAKEKGFKTKTDKLLTLK